MVSWIQVDTVGLLFGMMVIVGFLSPTGVFEWAAVKVLCELAYTSPT